METALRSLVKAILRNVIGLLAMALVGFAFTGSLAMGGKMALINGLVGLLGYLAYERAWARIQWGRGDV